MIEAIEGRQVSETDTSRETFIERLIWSRVRSGLVLDAFERVDRADFVRGQMKEFAYMKRALQMGEGASVSEPDLIGEMVDNLSLRGNEKVLEIGTGSGYTAAILSLCAREVHTIDYNQRLVNSACNRLSHLGFKNVTAYCGDGLIGLPNKAPFDAIIVTGGLREIPQAFVDQLGSGGRFVAPVGKDPDHLILTAGLKTAEELLTRGIENVQFHPLMSTEPGGFSDEQLARLRQIKRQFLEVLAEKERCTIEDLIQTVAHRLNLKPEDIDKDKLARLFPLPEEFYKFLG